MLKVYVVSTYVYILFSSTGQHSILLQAGRVFINVLTSGTFLPVGPFFLVPLVKEKLVLLLKRPNLEWGPFSIWLVPFHIQFHIQFHIHIHKQFHVHFLPQITPRSLCLILGIAEERYQTMKRFLRPKIELDCNGKSLKTSLLAMTNLEVSFTRQSFLEYQRQADLFTDTKSGHCQRVFTSTIVLQRPN